MSDPANVRMVVYGDTAADASGWIRLHAKPGDVICDLDRIIEAIAPAREVDFTDPVQSSYTAIAVMMREGLITFLEDRPTIELTVYVACWSEQTAQHLAARIGARVVYVGGVYADRAPAPVDMRRI